MILYLGKATAKLKRTDMAIYKSMGQMRGEAALEVFRRVMEREKDKSVAEIFAIAAKEPAPRFFVNFARAYRTVADMVRHGYRPPNEYKAAMYDELLRRWKAKNVPHFAETGAELLHERGCVQITGLQNDKRWETKR